MQADRLKQRIVIILTTGIFSCTSQIPMEKYEWIPSVNAPKNYPAEVYRGRFIARDGEVRIPAGHTLGAKNGQDWGMPGPAHYADNDFHEVPKALEITWLSYRENKFYTGRFPLPEDTINTLFKKGFEDRKGRQKSYTVINVGMAPGGKVAVWLAGSGKKVEIGWFQAKDTLLTAEEFMPGSAVSLEEHIRSTIAEDVEASEVEQRIPYEQWETYRKRYLWYPELDFEDKKNTVEEVLITFYNGEDLFTTGNNPELSVYEERAVPKHILVTWKDEQENRYRLKTDFDEQEIFGVFRKAFGDSEEDRLPLLIRVAKGSRDARIFFRGKEEEIPVNKADLKLYPVSK